MKAKDDYANGMMYEVFIHRANKSYDTTKRGADKSVMQNLAMIESGDTSFQKFHGTFDKQLDKAKTYMHKAMDKYLKMEKIPTENLDKLKALKQDLEQAYSTSDLMDIVNKSNELTQSVKEY